ncbi:c-type cytochrome [Rickettsia typhi]|uniref:Cytochrome c homolog n=2 Tax=Rickettsia typhi TaxID=785 RepID=CYCM_RICTY|nr:cytochrome c family protein [Rickettsia typhi]Q68XB6.1 RecName: Full=Cytochrome c homolog [Rickettsia typhi str. Wilmington]AAU03726.1 cytochrome c [Rickettsia typhi str. Wilmington]AFE54103.1 cytochrome c [Rickettsia typhi str. TH1527]AFE54942.1 cytochrome c [Rickettsia typhi str. B9991CWPP]
MTGKELNKIVAAILFASLIAMIVRFVANILYKPNLQVLNRGYSIAIQESSVNTNATVIVQEPVNIPEVMKTANANHGREIVKKCLMCHSLDKDGPNKLGPHLWNIVGRSKASITDYKYSFAISKLGGVWDDENLFAFLHKPSSYAPGTKMSFAGISKPQDIADVILFLKNYVHDK